MQPFDLCRATVVAFSVIGLLAVAQIWASLALPGSAEEMPRVGGKWLVVSRVIARTAPRRVDNSAPPSIESRERETLSFNCHAHRAS